MRECEDICKYFAFYEIYVSLNFDIHLATERSLCFHFKYPLENNI